MIATQDGKESLGGRVLAFFDVFDPSSICAYGDFVFGFTGDCASVTAYTFAVINQEAIFHIVSEERVQGFLSTSELLKVKRILIVIRRHWQTQCF